MRPAVPLLLVTLGIAASASAQLLQTTGGQSVATAEDLLGNFDSQFNYTYAEHQYTSNATGLGVSTYSANTAWSASNVAGSASGNGEAASVQTSLIDGAASASYTALMSGTGDLESTITGQGPYYGVLADSYAYTTTSFDFTPTVATTFTLSGELSHPGPLGELQLFLFDLTSGNTDFTFVNPSPGSFEINFSENLTAGDAYGLYAYVSTSSAVRYDNNAAGTLVQPGVCSTTTYLNATFAAPAPEPATCALLGLGAAALLKRRNTRATHASGTALSSYATKANRTEFRTAPHG